MLSQADVQRWTAGPYTTVAMYYRLVAVAVVLAAVDVCLPIPHAAASVPAAGATLSSILVASAASLFAPELAIVVLPLPLTLHPGYTCRLLAAVAAVDVPAAVPVVGAAAAHAPTLPSAPQVPAPVSSAILALVVSGVHTGTENVTAECWVCRRRWQKQ